MAITGASRKQAGLYYDKGGAVLHAMHPDFGATGLGVVDDATQLNLWSAALNALATGSVAAKGTLGIAKYLHGSTINFNEPRLLSIDAEGSLLQPNFDGVCVDLHSGYNPASAGTNIFGVHWIGGRFINGAATKLASVGIRAYAATDLVIDGAPYFSEFLSAIDISGQDTYIIRNIRTFDCDYAVRVLDIFGSAAAGQTLSVLLDSPHMHAVVACVYIVGTFSNFLLRGGSSNGAASLASFYAESGGGSGAINPFQIAIRDHHFEQGSSSSRYIYLKQTNSKSFFNVTIDSCSFGGNVGGDDAVRGACRFEAVKGLRIRNCQIPITSAGGGCFAYFDANCTNITIERENFFNVGTMLAWQASTVFAANQVVAPSTYGELVFRVTAGGGGASGATEPTWPTTVGGTVTDGALTWTAQCAPIIAKCARSQITVEPSIITLSHQGLTGYNTGKAFTGASAGTTLNMRALLGTKFPGTLLPPKGFKLYVTAKDTVSSTATDCGVRFAVDSTTYNVGGTDRKRVGIQLAGAANSQEKSAVIDVECDANGNIYMQTIPSATGTLTVWIVGVEAYQ